MGVVLPSGERPDELSLESGRAEAALIQQIPLLAGTSEEVYFLGARGRGASTIISSLLDPDATLSRTRSQASFSLLPSGAVALAWLDDA